MFRVNGAVAEAFDLHIVCFCCVNKIKTLFNEILEFQVKEYEQSQY